MNILKRILYLVLIILLFCIIGMAVYIRYYGQTTIQSALRNALGREVTFEDLVYQFPFHLRAYNIQVPQKEGEKNIFQAEKIMAQLSFEGLFRRKLTFNTVEVTEPVIVIDKPQLPPRDEPAERRYGTIVPPAETMDAEPAQAVTAKDEDDISVAINVFRLKGGKLQYINDAVSTDFSFIVEDAYMVADKMEFPVKPGKTTFHLTGRLIKEGNPLSGSSVEAHGWVDVARRDMDAHFEVIESDGTVGLAMNAVAKNNDMQVSGELNFSDILMGATKEPSTEASPTNDLISSALSAAGVKIGAKFSFRTKMDDIRPEKVSFSGNVVTK